jgi:hypothetical protein
MQPFRNRLVAGAFAIVLGGAFAVQPVAAQAEPGRGSVPVTPDAEPGGGVAGSAGDDGYALVPGRYAVLVDLDENMLYFKHGELTLWSAPVGTGTGLRVITHDDDWDFSTPSGRFQVQYKERNPLWIAPDWYFVENNLPVPPRYSAERHIAGTLGEAAVYISPHLAIHGTDRPELLGQRVSHGCIRLENRYAKRLYHNVQVGMEVIIVGGQHVRENARVVDLRRGYDPSLATAGGGSRSQVDRVTEAWRRMTTPELLTALDGEIAAGGGSRWADVAVLLMERDKAHDDQALQGLFARARGLPTAEMEWEWATLLVDAYRSSAPRVLETIARLEAAAAREAAALIVATAMAHFSGAFDDSAAPWPTRRMPRELLSGPALRGWDILAGAEHDHRGP